MSSALSGDEQLVLDGVYVREPDGGALVLHALAPPTADEVASFHGGGGVTASRRVKQDT
jgi:hypothetical protein